MFFTRNRAFTLIEILTAIIIIGILAGALMLVFPGKSDRATATSIINDLRVLKSASTQFYAANGTWPTSLEETSSMVSKNLKLECADEICYDVALDIEGNFIGVGAELSFAGSGVRSVLAGMADNNGLFADTGLVNKYSGGNVVISPVRSLRVFVNGNVNQAALFTADLSNLDQFVILNGNWNIVDGALRPDSTGPEKRIAFGETDWTDYTISATARVVDGALSRNSGYAIYYRADQQPGLRNPGISGYAFQFDTGYREFLVRVVTNGRESDPLFSVPMPENIDIFSPHNIDITVSGTTHSIKVDGSEVLRFDDSTYMSGSAGLRTWNVTDAEFTSIEVRE
jgi:prepilin-type N-terminal cleavage/methylation domain-containing protein